MIFNLEARKSSLSLNPTRLCKTATWGGQAPLLLKLGFVLVLGFITKIFQAQQQETNLNFCLLELFQIYFYRGFCNLQLRRHAPGQLSDLTASTLIMWFTFKCGHTCNAVGNAFACGWNGSSCPLRLTAGLSGVVGRDAAHIPALPPIRCRLCQDRSCSVCTRDLRGHNKSCNHHWFLFFFPNRHPASKSSIARSSECTICHEWLYRCPLVRS